MEGSKTLFCSSKSSWTRERISSKFLVWARALQNVRQPWYSLSCVFVEETFKSDYYENRVDEWRSLSFNLDGRLGGWTWLQQGQDMRDGRPDANTFNRTSQDVVTL